ncbi:MAG TPA: hypothetical protein VF171_04520 [Trueperaceae bacterium]
MTETVNILPHEYAAWVFRDAGKHRWVNEPMASVSSLTGIFSMEYIPEKGGTDDEMRRERRPLGSS